MVKVYLCSADISYSLLLPITPSEITISEGTDVRKYETANAGYISDIGYNTLTEVSFSSFFPSSHLPLSNGDAAFGIGYIPLLKRFRDGREQCRLIITGMGFDKTMIMDTFEYSMRQGGNVYYNMRFTQKREV